MHGAAEGTLDPVARLLSSTIVWANEAPDPRADRLALLASDLLAKSRATEDDGIIRWARSMGFVGPVGGSPTRSGVAIDVLARAQASLDSDRPDPAAVAAGLQAARRLIAAGSDAGGRDNLRLFIARLQLGGTDDRNPPAHLIGGDQ
jgi:hypothetical protein